jgi:hypothetical protein
MKLKMFRCVKHNSYFCFLQSFSMRHPALFSILIIVLVVTSFHCGNNKGTADATFCDTACNSDTLRFEGDSKLHPYVSISQKNCIADTLTWTHDDLPSKRQMQMPGLLNNTVHVNRSAMNCYIRDTAYAYLSFNDCVSGRGYLLKLPFSKTENIAKISSALNAFDKKFVVPDDLRAYADRSTLYVVDVATDKKEQMTFKEQFPIDFDNVHEVIDSINVSRNHMFVLLKKDGKEIPIEKKINL